MGIKVAILKPVGDGCNLSCDYCYVNGKPLKVNIMSLETAIKIIDELMSQNNVDYVDFLWHGGEPLLRDIDFYQRIFEYQKKYEYPKYRNSLQTNLTLLTHEWIDFFKDHNITLSTSLDGTIQLHNRNRKYPDGSGSYDKVTEKIKMAQEAGLKVNVLTVVSKTNMYNANEIFNELNSLNINHVGFLQCYSIVNNNLRYPSLEPGDYAKFLIDFFTLFLHKESSFKIREFEQLFTGIINVKQDVCCFTGHCSDFICINSNGDVYACDTSPQSSEYIFGNITKESLVNILSSEKRNYLIKDISNIHSDCTECNYLDYCHNGCYNMRIKNKYYFCADRQSLYEFMLDTARKLIKEGGE